MHYAIGDIHGHFRALDAILAQLRLGPNDRITFLGDYIDYGPDSRAVLDCILNLSGKVTVDTLIGNHEILLLGSIHDKDVEREWLRYGGDTTLHSFSVTKATDIPSKYINMLSRCRRWVETDDYVFVHAGVNPGLPMPRQKDEDLFWRSGSEPILLPNGKTLISGHTPHTNIIAEPGYLAIDTGIARGGYLTCVELSTYTFIQSDVRGVIHAAEVPRQHARMRAS